jgi:hypothetical protein
MKNLDDELKHALRREEPADGFVERVMARVEDARQQPLAPRPVGSGFSRIAPPKGGAHVGSVARWLAAAAVVLAMGGAGIQYRAAQIERARAEQAAGEAAGQRVMLALQIAGSKLHLVQSRINRLHEQTDRNTIQ